MIEVRPLNPVRTVGDPDTVIACFSDSEWRNLIELVRRYGFKSPDKEIQSPRPYDYPVVIDPKVSQGLLEAISAVYSNEEEGHVMPDVADTDPGLHVGQLQVKQFMDCVVIGAEQGGIEIRRRKDED